MRKQFAYILISVFVFVNFTACNSAQTEPQSSPGSSNTASFENQTGSLIKSDPGSSEIFVPEEKTPDGEPTFLTAPDGTPIYTSEITEVYKGEEEWGTKETITLEQAEQAALAGKDDFTVKCDGFFYGYIPERALNHVDDPEMFKQDKDDGEYYHYLGDEFDAKTGESKYSTEYSRIKAGDRFGTLTVRSAYTLFKDKYLEWRGEDHSDVPGAYIAGCGVEFDGEIELTGYLVVTKTETFYGEGGDMTFFPDGDSSMKIPGFSYFTNRKTGEIYHSSASQGYGYSGNDFYSLGNMYKVGCDTSGLQPGDFFVKVKVVLDNIKYVTGDFGGLKVELKNIEVL